MNGFLPVTMSEIKERGWEQVDFICITGDAYVDHPSFGIAIISRYLEALGFRVGIIAQPKSDGDYQKLGVPKYGFMVTGGNIDSMVSHYTVAKNRRKTDDYSPGGKAGLRPDRATIVYSKAVKRLFPESTIILGGLEASLRRFSHYDYWDDTVRKSILADSGADILVFGMGEHQVKEISERLKNGEKPYAFTDIRGTCILTEKPNLPESTVFLPSFEEVKQSKTAYANSCKKQYEEQDHVTGKPLAESYGELYLLQNPPALPASKELFDFIYTLPYQRTYHPMYESMGGVPAIKEVEFSITHNRGCFGACNFCSLAFHQGRFIVSRSKQSILEEAKLFTKSRNFKGYIHDVGGPTANFRFPSCKKQQEKGLCKNRKCLAPEPCKNLEVDHSEYLDILTDLSKLKGVKKVFVRSGIRFDYLIADKNRDFLRALIQNHISGQLKVAPEHCSDNVLSYMGKPQFKYFREFYDLYFKENKRLSKNQYLVPYFMSSHPGSTLKDAIKLAEYLKSIHFTPEQVQDFYPTPGTISTCMYYTGINPLTMKEVYVPKEKEEKAMQRALLQYDKQENRALVIKALQSAGRKDLIGFSKDCLVKPMKTEKTIEYRLNGQKKTTKKR